MLSSNKLQALLDLLQDAVFAIEGGRFIFVNSRTCTLLGYQLEEIIEQPFTDVIHPDDREMVFQRYQARHRGEHTPSEYSFRVITKLGEVKDVMMRVGTVIEEEGTITSLGSLQDITDYKRTQLELKHTQQDIESILNNMSDVFYRTDMNGIVTMISKSALDIIGYRPEEMIGRPLSEFYYDPDDRERVVEVFQSAEGRAVQVESQLRHKDGAAVWVSTNAYLRLDANGEPECIEGIARDVTLKKQLEERLKELVKYDELTQLFNRRHFLNEANKHTELARRHERPLSVMMIDLDWFKRINDTFGHKAGDTALSHFSNICRNVFRKTDLIGRFGGEEFVALFPETPIEDAYTLAERLREQIQEKPLCYGDKQICLTFSSGLTSLLPHDETIDDSLRRADKLLYRAKQNGRDQTVYEA